MGALHADIRPWRDRLGVVARLNKSDWVQIGLNALRDGGEASLRLEAICDAAGKTRGSFYHHFETHETFVGAVLSRWRADNTDDVIEASASAETIEARSDALTLLASTLDHRLELSIRRMAASNSAAADAVAAVDRRRIEYLRTLQADPVSDAAADYALLEYAVFVGLQAINPDIEPARAQALGNLTSDMIAAHWNE